MNKILYNKAYLLRKNGFSYSQISRTLGIPKSTLSSWFANKKWSRKIKSELQDKWLKTNTNRILEINRSRRTQTSLRHDSYREEAAKSYKTLAKNPLFRISLALYWAEGDKTQKGRVAVINSDVNLLKLIRKFYSDVLKIPKSKLRAAIFIYEKNKISDSVNYWSTNLQLNKKQFIKTQILPNRSKLTKRKLKYGICNLYFSSTEFNIKIKKWIEIMSKEMRH